MNLSTCCLSIRMLLLCFWLFANQSKSQAPIYVTSYPYGDLYRVELGTCTSTFVGHSDAMDIAITPNRSLWTTGNQSITRIDTLNGTPTYSLFVPDIDGISLVAQNDSILIATTPLTELVSINTRTGLSNKIGKTGHQASGDLAWYDGTLYMSSFAGLLKIKLNSSGTQMINLQIVDSFVFNYNDWGLGSAKLSDNVNYLIGTPQNDSSIYKICPFTGAHAMLCPAIIKGLISGIASARLPFQNPPLNSCSWDDTGIKTASIKPPFCLNPNPCSQIGWFEADFDLRGSSAYIYNSEGKEFQFEYEIIANRLQFDISNLPMGLYFLHVVSSSRETRCKVVKTD